MATSPGSARQAEEVDWDRLDKNKFFMYGAGMFSGVTLALYPLSVIKTKQMTLPGISGGFKGARQTASTIMRAEGVPGFYRGFTTVIFGTIPARAVYLTTLEWTKSEVGKSVAGLGLTEPTIAGVSNFFGGALASLATQSVTVPIDVISQKQMVHGDETVVARQQHSRAGPGQGASAGQGAPAVAGHATGTGATAATGTGAAAAGETAAAARASGGASTSGRGVSTAAAAEAAAGKRAGSGVVRIGPLQMVRLIVKEEGVAGLYRGFGASVATFVPSSAVWWGAYGAYQKLIWTLLYGSGSSTADAGSRGNNSSSSGSAAGSGGSGTGAGAGLADLAGGVPPGHSTGEVVAVQTTASVLAGCTSSIATTPLDLIKTRIQVSYRHDGATPSFLEVARQIAREDGAAGFLRGAVPRMVNASLWGTCMVTVYEHLKRICQKDD